MNKQSVLHHSNTPQKSIIREQNFQKFNKFNKSAFRVLLVTDHTGIYGGTSLAWYWMAGGLSKS
ncbi:unnamed protein product [Gongylonema pulchrum]|uniref:Uncharacterized protein n=1 Tax=Gongylonema pulchrum TaxID=637853 RepID=A0A183D4D7_9BILA|nr:unnamed protein product [Gongylonema pulchrum]